MSELIEASRTRRQAKEVFVLADRMKNGPFVPQPRSVVIAEQRRIISMEK